MEPKAVIKPDMKQKLEVHKKVIKNPETDVEFFACRKAKLDVKMKNSSENTDFEEFKS